MTDLAFWLTIKSVCVYGLGAKMSNILENGLVLLQIFPNKAVDLSGGRTHGWLFYQHIDGYYVTERKLEDWEIMQAEDQRDYGIVIDGREKYFKTHTSHPDTPHNDQDRPGR